MVAENCKIKVPGVMKNHTLSVHVLDVLKMTEDYDKCMNVWHPWCYFFLSYYYQRFLVLIYHHKISIDFSVVEYV